MIGRYEEALALCFLVVQTVPDVAIIPVNTLDPDVATLDEVVHACRSVNFDIDPLGVCK